MFKLRNRRVIRFLATIGTWVLRVWFRTARVTIHTNGVNLCPYDDTGDERFLYCIWHDGVIGVLLSGKCRWMSGLVSGHADGSWVSDIMNGLSIRPIRGSSSRRGAEALREMMSAAEGWHIAIATDGPRGPRREVKQGIIWLASQTGRRIVPVAFSAEKPWTVKGKWTDMVFPRPFSKTHLAGGEPISIPTDLNREQLEEQRLRVQAIMDDFTNRFERHARGEQVDLFPSRETDSAPSNSDEVRRAA